MIAGTVYGSGPSEELFRNPPVDYRPVPFWHLNGTLTTEGIYEQVGDAYRKDGFGGVTVLPVNAHDRSFGTSPLYLSEEYFGRYRDILEVSRSQGTGVILYDDIDFPSGSANGEFARLYPQMAMKQLSMEQTEVKRGETLSFTRRLEGLWYGTVAVENRTRQVVDISSYDKDGFLQWKAPEGDWTVMSFTLEYGISRLVDYMQPEAVEKFIALTYNRYADRFGDYFGNTIRYTFFDDVGFHPHERMWTESIAGIFPQRTGRDMLTALPALWTDIGPDTDAVKVAFFDIRSELMAEGYVRMVAEWSASHGLQSMGHPPGNYEPNPAGMHGDVLKYYRHTQIPLMDAIHGYGYGRPGYKLISSAADLYGRPIVAAEIYGNYHPGMDSLQMYQAGMEVFARGVNFLVPHGMWYDPERVRIPPLVAHYNPALAPALHRYSDWAARCMTLLREGSRVSEIAVLWPINSLEGWFGFNEGRPQRVMSAVPPESDYRRISDLLTGEIRRDFTFVHPEMLASERYRIENGRLLLDSDITGQQYGVLIMPASHIESVATLRKVKEFFDNGGKVIATGRLPHKSAELGMDDEVASLVGSVFGVDPRSHNGEASGAVNPGGGRTVFIPSAENLEAALEELEIVPDIRFENIAEKWNTAEINEPNNHLRTRGMLSYIHKKAEGRDIWFFANSAKEPVSATVLIKGRIRP